MNTNQDKFNRPRSVAPVAPASGFSASGRVAVFLNPMRTLPVEKWPNPNLPMPTPRFWGTVLSGEVEHGDMIWTPEDVAYTDASAEIGSPVSSFKRVIRRSLVTTTLRQVGK